MSKVKEYMKGRKISHKSAVCAVPEICIPITVIITITIRTLFVQSLKLAWCDHAENGLSDMIKLPRSYDRITMVIWSNYNTVISSNYHGHDDDADKDNDQG